METSEFILLYMYLHVIDGKKMPINTSRTLLVVILVDGTHLILSLENVGKLM